jgi:hypothetical protein
MRGIADRQVRWKGCTVDGIGMSESTVDEVHEVAENGYRDRRSLEAELQEIVRAKTPEPSPSSGFWARRRRKV